jgi:ribonuclease/clavin/mitogillin
MFCFPFLQKGCQVFKFPRSDATESTSFVPIVDGQTFEVDGATLTALHTPGHTTDHVILHLKVSRSDT